MHLFLPEQASFAGPEKTWRREILQLFLVGIIFMQLAQIIYSNFDMHLFPPGDLSGIKNLLFSQKPEISRILQKDSKGDQKRCNLIQDKKLSVESKDVGSFDER